MATASRYRMEGSRAVLVEREYSCDGCRKRIEEGEEFRIEGQGGYYRDWCQGCRPFGGGRELASADYFGYRGEVT